MSKEFNNENKGLNIYVTSYDFVKTDENGVQSDKRRLGFGALGQYADETGKINQPNAIQALNKLGQIETFLHANNVDPRKMPIVITGDKVLGEDGKEKASTVMVARFYSHKYTNPETAQVGYINKVSISYGQNTTNPETGEIEYAPSISATRGKNGYVMDSDKYINKDVLAKFSNMVKNVDSYGKSAEFSLGMNDKSKLYGQYPQLANLSEYISQNGGAAVANITFAEGRGAIVTNVTPVVKKEQVQSQQMGQDLNKAMDQGLQQNNEGR